MKRLIVGFRQPNEDFYTNVLRITRAALHSDTRHGSEVGQVVFYSSGVGAEPNAARSFAGATGAGLATKVQEAYAFICENWVPGDEICIFRFSRGAYTARIVASIIGEIGILTDKVELEKFPSLFLSLQNAGNHPTSELVQTSVDQDLRPYVLKRKKQVAAAPNGYLIKVAGVYDTVGALGVPQEICRRDPRLMNIFGFNDTKLGKHIQFAYQALALDETRADFSPIKWIQTAAGKDKGQVLKQVWFAGSHSDVGGGFEDHDLADISLAWMIAETESVIAYDLGYIARIPDRIYPWGEQPPHNARAGLMRLSLAQVRAPPTQTDDDTREFIHASVRSQGVLTPSVAKAIEENPALIQPLLPFEEAIKAAWVSKPNSAPRPAKKSLAKRYNNVTLPIELNQTTPIIQLLYYQLAIRVSNVGLRTYAFAKEVVPGGADTLQWAADEIECFRVAANNKSMRVSEKLFGRFFRRAG